MGESCKLNKASLLLHTQIFPFVLSIVVVRLPILIILYFCMFVTACVFTQVNSVYAQTQFQTDPVGTRKPEGFEANGRIFRGIKILPRLEVDTEYNDNLFLNETNTTEDIGISVRPKVSFIKEIRDHSFSLDLESDFTRYIENDNENTESYFLGHQGIITVLRDLVFQYGLEFRESFLSRNTVGGASQSETPVERQSKSLSLGFIKQFNRLSVDFRGGYSETEFEDNVFRDSGDTLAFSNNNRSTTRLKTNFNYSFKGENVSDIDHNVFLTLSMTRQNFETRNSDNNKYGFLTGFQTSYKDLVFGRVGIGYFRQNFDNASIDAAEAFDFTANVSYNPFSRLTLILSGNRDINFDNDTSQGVVQTTLGLNVDYEAYHNTFLSAGVTYDNQDVSGSSSDFDTNTYSLGLQHYLSRYISSSLELIHETRDSSGMQREYDQNIIRLGITGEL